MEGRTCKRQLRLPSGRSGTTAAFDKEAPRSGYLRLRVSVGTVTVRFRFSFYVPNKSTRSLLFLALVDLRGPQEIDAFIYWLASALDYEPGGMDRPAGLGRLIPRAQAGEIMLFTPTMWRRGRGVEPEFRVAVPRRWALDLLKTLADEYDWDLEK